MLQATTARNGFSRCEPSNIQYSDRTLFAWYRSGNTTRTMVARARNYRLVCALLYNFAPRDTKHCISDHVSPPFFLLPLVHFLTEIVSPRAVVHIMYHCGVYSSRPSTSDSRLQGSRPVGSFFFLSLTNASGWGEIGPCDPVGIWNLRAQRALHMYTAFSSCCDCRGHRGWSRGRLGPTVG